MSNVLEIFNPYLPFLVSFITIGLSLFLAIKGVNIWAIVIVNLILSVVIFPALGLQDYDLISQILGGVIDIIITIAEKLVKALTSPLKKLFDGFKFYVIWDLIKKRKRTLKGPFILSDS